MIAKKFRLSEKEVKKVLQKGKPFFSHGIVVNSFFNKCGVNRFGIVIGGKSVNTNVTRVFFRRKFYDMTAASGLFLAEPSLVKGEKNTIKGRDYVFVVKKQTKLDRKDETAVKSFEKDLSFLIKKLK